MAGGRIVATFRSDGQRVVVTNEGDYIYPADVRFEPATDRLYVVARGLAGGILNRTYLMEYDLRERRLVDRRRVNGRYVAPACQSTRDSVGPAELK